LLSSKVDKRTTINNKELTYDITINKTDIGLDKIDNTSDLNKPISKQTQSALNLKVDKTTKINNKNLSSNITLLKSDIGLSNVDNTSDLNKPISTTQQTSLNLKENTSNKNIANGYAGLDSTGKLFTSQIPISGLQYLGVWNANTNTPVITSSVGSSGNYYKVSVDGSTNIDGLNTWNVGDWIIFNGNTWDKIDNTDIVSSVNGQIGTVVLTKSDIGLSNIDNTSDVNKPVSTAQQTALDLKADKTTTINGHELNSNISLTKFNIGLSNADNTSDVNKPVSTAQQTALDLKADKTTTINGYALNSNISLTKFNIGLSNADNTSDVNKPVSTAQQTALNLKENTSNKNIANGYAGLDSTGKLFTSQIPISGLQYLGVWNANTNTPVITSSVGTAGNYYKVSVDGSTNINSINVWNIGDWIIFNGSTWDKIDNTDIVSSVNGQIGSVVLTKSDIGLSNVDNTSDVNKPVSTAQQTALNLKADKTIYYLSGNTISYYNVGGTLLNSPFTNGTIIYGVCSVYENVNWVTNITSVYRIILPFSGLYLFSYTGDFTGSTTPFILKNTTNLTTSVPSNMISMDTSTDQFNIFGISNCTQNDYICFGVKCVKNAVINTNISSFRISLIQRS
jgi:hypothetical protein